MPKSEFFFILDQLSVFNNQDLVPCILVTFEKEQIVVWRGNDYKPPLDSGCFLTVRESFNDGEGEGSTNCVDEGDFDDDYCEGDFHSGNKIPEIGDLNALS